MSQPKRSGSKSFAHELNAIAHAPGNEYCADCGIKGPRWASVNLGILICIDCSGTHRSMGTHISVVKSLSLDRWNQLWIDVVRGVGNTLGKAYYEYGVPKSQQCPDPKTSKLVLDMWIRNKYERKLYIPPNSHPPSYYVLQNQDPLLSFPSVPKPLLEAYNKSQSLERPANKTPTSKAAVNKVTKSCEVDLLGISDEDFTIPEPQISSTLPIAPPTENLTPEDLFALSRAENDTSPIGDDIATGRSLAPSASKIASSGALMKAKIASASASIDELCSHPNNILGFKSNFPFVPVEKDPPFPEIDLFNFPAPQQKSDPPSVQAPSDYIPAELDFTWDTEKDSVQFVADFVQSPAPLQPPAQPDSPGVFACTFDQTSKSDVSAKTFDFTNELDQLFLTPAEVVGTSNPSEPKKFPAYPF